ncbi:MAG: hypothetical protein IJW79_09930 [Clostridia bacterium]|nr:hypothetical protein [Clostridia bacterium]
MTVTKERYLSLMDKALSAYTDEHIERYFNEVKTDGLKEHGFPRLTVCIGILIAHGRREYLREKFYEMMEFCCKTIPNVKAANDFSVREIIFCIIELEKHKTFAPEIITRWKNHLTDIVPEKCYNVFAKKPTDGVYNWALFTGVSEHLRQYIGLNDTSDFVDLQIESQLKHLDENLMYKDAPKHPPMVYDMVSRALFAMLLHFGYRGKHFEILDECLRKTGLLTLKMQSVTGEIPFGGRSNQFHHNEGLTAMIGEFEANRYKKEGDLETAKKFKSAVSSAINYLEKQFDKKPMYHIKNRFPLETRYGCEEYGYFDKYMITTASWMYMAYAMCDEAIPCAEDDFSPVIFQTSDDFHKLFIKCGGYALEFDLNADKHYDASGLGRVHKAGAPSAICMSLPCVSSEHPNYFINAENAEAFSLCPCIFVDGKPIFAVDEKAKYTVSSTLQDEKNAYATLECEFENGETVTASYTLGSGGVEISVSGNGEIGFALPAFDFDGESHTEITQCANSLSVAYEGWKCRYTIDGEIADSVKTAYNRNGYYRAFYAKGKESLGIKIEIIK